MTRAIVVVLAAGAWAGLAVAADPPAPLPVNLAGALTLPPPTPADVAAADQAAAAFQRQFPRAFPGGVDLAPAAAAPAPAAARGLPAGVWARTDTSADGAVTITTTVRVRADGIEVRCDETKTAGRTPRATTFTLTADTAYNPTAGRIIGVVTHVDATGAGAAEFRGLMADAEGAPFTAAVRVVDGNLLVGRPRAGVDGAAAKMVFVTGTFKPVVAPVPAPAVRPVGFAAPAERPVPAALGGVVGQELGAMLGEMAGRPDAGSIVGSAVGAAVGTALERRAADDTARAALATLEAVAGWLGVKATAAADAGPVVVEK